MSFYDQDDADRRRPDPAGDLDDQPERPDPAPAGDRRPASDPRPRPA
ncbi:MAG: hypothetical protein JWM05_1522, partial [Acidimicrobiales bacterium]|nr:hypothetical protein [Acidimicrobiales bacterium]